MSDCTGVVSEADLLRHEVAGEHPNGLLPEPRLSARDRDLSEATTARGLITSPAVCARPERTVVEACRLIGIVSRSDLLPVFPRHDQAIREIRRDVIGRVPGLSPDQLGVKVTDGMVTLTGKLEHSIAHALIQLAMGVDGDRRCRPARLPHR